MSLILTTQDLRAISRVAPNDVTAAIVTAINKYSERYDVTSVLRMSMFLANGCGETGGFTKLVENMNYSAPRLRAVWPRRFPNDAIAQRYANNPRDLANFVYGGRMGNQGIPDAGWNYRGRGFFQTTGRTRYEEVERATGLKVVDDPDMLADPDTGVLAAFIYWQQNGLAPHADRGDVRRARYAINGGYVGLADVQHHYNRATLHLGRPRPPVTRGVGAVVGAAVGRIGRASGAREGGGRAPRR